MRWVRGKLYLLDWPHVRVGPAEFDLVAFAQSITIESGLAPEKLVAWYEEHLKLDPIALDSSVAALAGFFASQAIEPHVPELPRLRTFQRQQLAVTLAWAARRLGLPEPAWLNGMP